MSAAIILAGGKSRRLGRDKASEVLLGRTLLQRALDSFAGLADEYVVVRAAGQELPGIEADVPVLVVEDAFPDAGPLGGLYTGLSAMSGDCAIAVACDMPLLQAGLLGELLRLAPDRDAVVPVMNQPQPLCAAYAKSCLEPLLRRLEMGAYRLTDALDDLDTLYLPPEQWRRFDRDGLSFQNINDELDLRRVEALLLTAAQSQ